MVVFASFCVALTKDLISENNGSRSLIVTKRYEKTARSERESEKREHSREHIERVVEKCCMFIRLNSQPCTHIDNHLVYEQ